MCPSRRFLASSGLLLLLALPAFGAAPPSEVDRLAHLAKLWGTVHYLHPYLAYKEIDWDGALVRAIPGVRAARTPAEYAAAAQTMLAALGDPATHVQAVPERSSLPPAASPRRRSAGWTSERSPSICDRTLTPAWTRRRSRWRCDRFPESCSKQRR